MNILKVSQTGIFQILHENMNDAQENSVLENIRCRKFRNNRITAREKKSSNWHAVAHNEDSFCIILHIIECERRNTFSQSIAMRLFDNGRNVRTMFTVVDC
jgi:hypothetical protein